MGSVGGAGGVPSSALKGALSYLPPPSATFPSDSNPAYVVPTELMSQLLSSNLRLERILANPTSYLLEQIESAISSLLEDPNTSIEEKNRRYASLLNLQAKVKEGLIGSDGAREAFPATFNVLPRLAGVEEMDPYVSLPPANQAPSMSVPQPPNPANLPPSIPPLPRTGRSGDAAKMSSSERAVLLNVPADQRSRAEEFIQELRRYPKTFAQNSLGNIVIDGKAVAGSNFADIVSVLFKKAPPNVKNRQAEYWESRLPRGSEEFLRSFAKTPLGAGLIKNDFLVQKLNQLRQDTSSNSVSSAQLAAYKKLAQGSTPGSSDTSFEKQYAPIWQAFDDFRDKYQHFKRRSESNVASSIPRN